MTILCRNEVDVIEANIRTHAQLGVDAFVVMDNGSTDGTREKLTELSEEYDLSIIDQPEQTYRQREWMLQLAHHARTSKGARWVISNDADEFWLPDVASFHSLKETLKDNDSVVTVNRHNMLLDEAALEPHYDFAHASWRVNYPVCYSTDVQKRADNVSMLLVPISPKVIVNPAGLIKLSGGNHRAKHWGKPFSARTSEDLTVFHYPIRSFEQFKANVEHRAELLKLKNVRMGDHYRRWVRLYQAGRLEQEFERIVLTQTQLEVLEDVGVAVPEKAPGQAINRAMSRSG
ncbi:MAG: glycosyltransferase family 2 protein [Hydrogenovibrio sp.]|uniref:glycosyltransferase family 2 protein n=1 Tax=Hydrogenovibrio sp. TaxID=2065821 RepID=UPI00287046EA|nr:glycosyltransferase family 2 protein [Hydrogenovibrio sp.]MDR9498558.1 glycosyltransferase family 2 protein [Hydrogenovibrio sp.]MDR9499212.1 glycosyltransferase family 2 protein [Hydrogenovibrio sp.]